LRKIQWDDEIEKQEYNDKIQKAVEEYELRLARKREDGDPENKH